MTAQLRVLISNYETKGDFTHTSLTDSQLNSAQSVLNLILPVQYIEFLREYGHGGIGGIEILGVGKTGNLLFVKETLQFREYGLPSNLIVIEDCDEWIYCLDCITDKVVSWNAGALKEEYTSFDEYLLNRFQDASENI